MIPMVMSLRLGSIMTFSLDAGYLSLSSSDELETEENDSLSNLFRGGLLE
mgnify:CR=1 FL=1